LQKTIEDMKARTANLTKRCEAANESYLRHLQEFRMEMMVKDRERESDDKGFDLALEIFMRKLMGKGIKKQAREMRDLSQPKGFLSLRTLEAIYIQLKAILSKRGWYEEFSGH